MLHLVTGRANSGASAVLHEHVIAAVHRGGSAAVLVPSVADAAEVREELASECSVGVDVATLDSWIDGRWGLLGDGSRIVSPGARREIISSVLGDEAEPLLDGLRESRGLVSVLAELAARAWRDVDPSSFDAVDAAIARTLAAYRARLRRLGLIERAEAAHRLGRSPSILPEVVAVDRFSDLSGYQERLLASLGAHTEVWLSLPWEGGFPATEGLTPLVERLLVTGEPVALPEPAVGESESGELRAVETKLYRAGEERVLPEGDVGFRLASGSEAEIELAADTIAELIDEGTDPERIALAFRDLGTRALRLTAALETRGVPADVDVAMPFGHTPYGRAMLQILATAGGRGTRADTGAYLSSPFSGADPDKVRAIDASWRRSRVEDHRRLLEDAARCGALAKRAIRAARGAFSAADPDALAVHWKDLADALLAAALRVARRGGFDARLDAAAHRAVLGAVNEARSASVLSDTHRFIEALRDEAVATSGSGTRGVYVTEVRRLRSRRFDAVVVGGLTAGEFSSDRGETLEESLARRMGFATGPEPRLAERLAFYLLATRARRRLILLRMLADSRGEALRASVFWDEVADLYRDPLDDDVDTVPAGLPVRELRLTDLATSAPAFTSDRGKRRAAVSSAGPGVWPTLERGGLDEAGRRHLSSIREFSVTELETYLSCPYRWFYERVVAPRELDRPLDARERGSRAHTILSRFYERFSAEGYERVRPENLTVALEVMDAVVSEVESSASVRPIGLREHVAASQAAAWAREVVVDDAGFLPGFVPVAHELAFGGDSGHVLEIAGVRLRGSIDRVDLSHGALVVTDYKSAATLRGRSQIVDRAMLQLPVYMRAAETLLGQRAIGGLYRSLKTLDVRGFWLKGETPAPLRCAPADHVTESELGELVVWCDELVVESAGRMRAGEIAPQPRNADACRFCAASECCAEAVS